MDELMPIMVPIESNASVYSIVYPGEQQAIAGDAMSFFDVLIQEFAKSVTMGEQQMPFQNFMDLQFPVVTQSNDVVTDGVTQDQTQSDALAMMFPTNLFMNFDSEMLTETDAGMSQPEIPSDEYVPLLDSMQRALAGAEAALETTGSVSDVGMLMLEDGDGADRTLTFSQEVMIRSSLPLESVFGDVMSETPSADTLMPNEQRLMEALLQRQEHVPQPELFFEHIPSQGNVDKATTTEQSQAVNTNPNLFEAVPEKDFAFYNETVVNREEFFMNQPSFINYLQEKAQLQQPVESMVQPGLGVQQQVSTDLIAEKEYSLESLMNSSQQNSDMSHSDTAKDSNTFNDASGQNQFSQAMMFEPEGRVESTADARVKQAHDMQQIAQQLVKSAQLRQGANYSEFSLALEPEYLGSLKVSVALEGETIVTRIAAENSYTRELLSNNLGMLKESFQNAGIKFDEIQVMMDDGETAFEFQQNQSEAFHSKTSGQQQTEQPFSISDVAYEPISSADVQNEQTSGKNGFFRIDFLA